ncbi:MAG: acyl-CoA desaturase [Proteobacteria bacterium]|nr:acyl-CoA desaturase [Pseudomonadota bacterium]
MAQATTAAPPVDRNNDRLVTALDVLLPLLGVGTALYLLLAGHHLSIWNVIIFASMWLATFFGVEGGFHRLFSHQSYIASPRTRQLLAILGSMAFQGPVIWWAATHRNHHKLSDRPGDPHSPNLGKQGLLRRMFYAHIGWLFSRRTALPQEWMRYAPDLFRDRAILAIHMRYWYWVGLGLVIPTVLGGLLTWSLYGAFMGFLWGGLVRIFLVTHGVWAINSICHTFGKRHFRTKDRSTNVALLSIATVGGAWHNNHHAFPGSAICGFRLWHFDISGWIIVLLHKLGLVSKIHRPSPQAMARRAINLREAMRIAPQIAQSELVKSQIEFEPAASQVADAGTIPASTMAQTHSAEHSALLSNDTL